MPMLLCSECGHPASYIEGGRGLCHEDAQAAGIPRNPRPLTPHAATVNSTAPESGVSYSFTATLPPVNDSRAEEAP